MDWGLCKPESGSWDHNNHAGIALCISWAPILCPLLPSSRKGREAKKPSFTAYNHCPIPDESLGGEEFHFNRGKESSKMLGTKEQVAELFLFRVLGLSGAFILLL